MEYLSTTVFIIYCKPEQTYFIHRDHHDWFDEYNYRIYTEDKDTPVSLLLQQYPEILISNSDIINLVPCELVLTYNTFRDIEIITYEIVFTTSGKKIGFN